MCAQAQVDVAGVALTLVKFRHEGYGAAVLGGDLLGAVLVDGVPVRGRKRAVEPEVDLMLPEVALAFGVLHGEPRPRHRVADAPEQGLYTRRPQERVVDIVIVGGLQIPVPLAPGTLVGIHKDYELEFCTHEGFEAALGEAFELALENLPWRGHDRRAVLPEKVAGHERRPLLPGNTPEGLHVRLEDEVAVAALPGGHRVALHGVHLHVHGEQVVAALGVVLDHLVEKVGRRQTLALQASLHIRHREEDGVYSSGLYLRPQRFEVEATLDLRRVHWFLLLSSLRPARIRPSRSWQTPPPAPGSPGGGDCRGGSR